MDAKPRSPGNVAGAWLLALHALRSRPVLTIATAATIVIAIIGLMQFVDPVGTVIVDTLLRGVGEMTAAVVYRIIILLIAYAACLVGTLLAVSILESLEDTGAVQDWSPRLMRRAALAWLIALAAPYLFGSPWGLVDSMAWVRCCASLSATMRIFADVLCWATLKAGLAAALLVGLPDTVLNGHRQRGLEEGRDLFLMYLPLFVAPVAVQVAIDVVFWKHLEDDWQLVSDVAVAFDALVAVMATLLTFTLRRRLDTATSPAIFD